MPEFKWDERSFNNPVELALELIGGKWKMPILWRLKERPWRYNELRRDLGRVTHKMLTEQLKELQRHGLIHREVLNAVPPHVEYSLTIEGKKCVPVINSLREFGKSYLTRNPEGPPGIDEARAGPS
jgi:DNA-binding HxlR family transcriptional regulator